MISNALHRLTPALWVLGLSLSSAILHAQDKPAAPAPGAPPAYSEEVVQKIQEAQQLQGRQRFVDAMTKLDEVEKLAPELADIYNMRGSIYLSPGLRDFDKAQEQFEKAEKLSQEKFPAQFNQAELQFVKHDWAVALKEFQALLDENPKLPMQVRHIVVFKRLVCEAKLDQLDAAEKTLKENFTFMDDTPAYYFSKAAIAFQKKDQPGAQEWMVRGQSIFKPALISVYLDSLMEVRWVPNIGLPPMEK